MLVHIRLFMLRLLLTIVCRLYVFQFFQFPPQLNSPGNVSLKQEKMIQILFWVLYYFNWDPNLLSLMLIEVLISLSHVLVKVILINDD